MKSIDLEIREAAVTDANRTVGREKERLKDLERYSKRNREDFAKTSDDLMRAERALSLARVDLARLEESERSD